MIITCKACNTSFNLDENLLKPGGSKVRCSKCKKVLIAYPPAPPKEAAKPTGIISDLELKQVTEDTETGQLDDSGPGELDLPDLEKLFAEEEIPEKEGADGEAIEDFELDLDLAPEPDKAPEDVEEEAKFGEPDEVELDLDMGAEPADSALLEETPGTELDEIEEKAEKPETVAFFETEEIEREFAIEDTGRDDLSEEEIAYVQPVVAKTKSAMKKRVSKPLIVLLILVLLGGGCYGIYVVLDFMNIKIPFVSDYFKPQILDPAGNLKIDTFDIDNTFVKNAKAGKLFVITGRIKNGYSDDRSFIRVTGELYAKGQILVQKKTVFCGNVLSDIELSNLKLPAIKKRLSNRLGDNKSNVRVKPGQELPFMIVFANFPGNLEEFAIEAKGSVQG